PATPDANSAPAALSVSEVDASALAGNAAPAFAPPPEQPLPRPLPEKIPPVVSTSLPPPTPAAAAPTPPAVKPAPSPPAAKPAAKAGKTLYRAYITGFSGREAAQAFCDKLKAGGRACFVK